MHAESTYDNRHITEDALRKIIRVGSMDRMQSYQMININNAEKMDIHPKALKSERKISKILKSNI